MVSVTESTWFMVRFGNYGTCPLIYNYYITNKLLLGAYQTICYILYHCFKSISKSMLKNLYSTN